MDVAETEERVLRAAGQAFAEACLAAPGMIACRPGCSDCCHRPFAITEFDEARLWRGLLTLPEAEAAGIRERAQAAWRAMAADFPGDASTGALDDSVEWRDWFFARHQGRACPVLDPRGGTCQLHDYRPVACRLYGPLIRIGAARSEPCPKNYVGLDPGEVEALAVTVPDDVFLDSCDARETVISFALS